MDKGKLVSKVGAIFKVILLIIMVVLIAQVVRPKSFGEMKKEAFSGFEEFTKANFKNPQEFQGPYLDVSDKEYTIFRWYKLSQDTSVIGVHVSSSIWKSNYVSGEDSSWEAPSL